MGAHAVEVDLRQTKDGQFVIFHDPDLKRIDGTSVLLKDLSVRELDQRLAKASLPPVLTLAQLKVEYNQKLPVVFDLKLEQLPKSLVEMLDSIPFFFYLGLRTLSTLQAVSTRWDRTRILALVSKPAAIVDFLQAGAGIVRLWEDWVTPERMLTIKNWDAQVWVMMGKPGAVGHTDEKALARILPFGVDGILLNDPQIALNCPMLHSCSRC